MLGATKFSGNCKFSSDFQQHPLWAQSLDSEHLVITQSHPTKENRDAEIISPLIKNARVLS